VKSRIGSVAAWLLVGAVAGASAQTVEWVADDDAGSWSYRIYQSSEDGPETIHLGPERGVLGSHVIELSAGLRHLYGVDVGVGVMISRIVEDSPAAAAGLRVGDVIVAIEGAPVRNELDLKQLLADCEDGASVRLSLQRDGERVEASVIVSREEARLIELREFFRRGNDGRVLLVPPVREWQRLPERPGVQWRGEPLDEALESALRALEDPELRRRIEAELERREMLEQRLEKMEHRLRELERQLKKDDG